MSPAMWLMCVVESFLWIALVLLFRRKGLHRRFRAMGHYLALQAVSASLLLVLLYEMSQPGSRARYLFFCGVYGFTFFATYFAAAVLMFFIGTAVFRTASAPFPGIARPAAIVFRGAAFISVVVGLSFFHRAHICFLHFKYNSSCSLMYSIEYSVSILLLCLLAFVCLSMWALRLSMRDLVFGIALGFIVMVSNNLIFTSWILASRHFATYNSPVQFLNEALILAAQVIWMAYCIPAQSSRPRRGAPRWLGVIRSSQALQVCCPAMRTEPAASTALNH